MPSRTVELGRFSLVHSAESLKLSIAASAQFNGPSFITGLDKNTFSLALKSRKLWVSRGRGCRIDIEVLHDGKPFACTGSSALLESLGCHIRDAKAWNQLILSTSLGEPSGVPSERLSHFSVCIKNSVKPPDGLGEIAAWIGDSNVIPPSAVSCMELEKIHIRFEFRHILQKAVKGVTDEIDVTKDKFADIFFFDGVRLAVPADSRLSQEADAHSLQQVVEGFKGLSSQLEALFGAIPSSTSKDQLSPELALRAPKSTRTPRDNDPSGISSVPVKPTAGRSKSKNWLPEIAIRIVDGWIGSHYDNMYPTMEEKAQLIAKTGLSKAQLNNLLARRRLKFNKSFFGEKGTDTKEEVLGEMILDNLAMETDVPELTQDGEKMLLDDVHDTDQIIDELDGDNFLSSQSLDIISSPFSSQTSQLSTVYSESSIGPESQTVQGGSRSHLPTLIDHTASLMLADTAFRILMGAAVSRSSLRAHNISFKKLPQLTITDLVPSMFSPGFKSLMAVNSRFLPTISHAISVSMPQNAQTPSLRRKLLQISYMESFSTLNPDHDLGKPGTGGRSSSAVQSKIWEMMQRKLLDRAAGKRLWRQQDVGEAEEDSEFEDMLGIHDKRRMRKEADAEKGKPDDEERLFWDDEDEKLLLEDDELYYDADWEQRAIEEDTEEMLLGDDWYVDRHDDEGSLLLEDSDIDLTGIPDVDSSMLLWEVSQDEEMMI